MSATSYRTVHTTHCCVRCGCKYGQNEICPVALGQDNGNPNCQFCAEDLDTTTPKGPFTLAEARLYETGYLDGQNSVLADLEFTVDEEGDETIKVFSARFERTTLARFLARVVKDCLRGR